MAGAGRAPPHVVDRHSRGDRGGESQGDAYLSATDAPATTIFEVTPFAIGCFDMDRISNGVAADKCQLSPTPANTYRWPQIPFVPSQTVHILYSGMRSPEQPVINHADTIFSAYGFTLGSIIVRAWEGCRWHVDIALGLIDDTRFDFLMVLPRQETTATCLGLLQSAIEQHFAVDVKRERRMRDVYVLTNTKAADVRYSALAAAVLLGATVCGSWIVARRRLDLSNLLQALKS